MDLGLLVTISCVMTSIAMVIFLGVILFFVRYGGQGVKGLIDRFTGGGDDKSQQEQPARTGQNPQPTVASSQSLRQRAHQLDFPAPAAGTAFAAQGASQGGQFAQPQQASLTPRGQGASFNPQAAQPAQGFQLSTPSLSPSRPFQAGSQFNPNKPQSQGLGQQQNQFGQQQGGLSQQNQFGQQQGGLGQPRQNPPLPQPPLGQQQGFNAQGLGQSQNPLGQPRQNPLGQQPPLGQPRQNQLGQQPPSLGQANQFGQQQGGLGQPRQNPLGQQPPPLGQQNQLGQQQNPLGQALPPPLSQPYPQGGGLGENRPPLRSVPRPGNTQYDRPIGGRDSRKGDDRDMIYDDRGGSLVDDVGDFIDNF